ncbi:MAG: hypothetical protein HUJ56_05030 [Erysipelotrichaceae bacterium]|nr:hypothetical protein [Erysipelotrichaceae bacterium]
MEMTNKIDTIFVDKFQSNLEDNQVNSINNILRIETDRFNRGTIQKQLDAPFITNIGASLGRVNNYKGKSYGNIVNCHFWLNVEGMTSGVGYQIIHNLPAKGGFIKGAGMLNNENTSLPGYFDWNTGKDVNDISIVFVYTGSGTDLGQWECFLEYIT